MKEHEKKYTDLLIYSLSFGLLLIFSMIIIGGLTRLTNSGLSITEWELFSGVFPPLNKNDWNIYFDLYKKIPQYILVNPTMSLNEFKVIFYWEYLHRILGRIIGVYFILLLFYFHYLKKFSFKSLKTIYIVLFLVIIQGIVGWYMVQSGLVNDVTVSHYRLSLHLTIAIIILCIIFWQILNLKKNTNKIFLSYSGKLFPFIFLIFLIFLQIVFGAFVSGLDAGKIYQTWPLMGKAYSPDDLYIINLRNIFDFNNHSLVQFYHRNLAYFITLYVLILSYFVIKSKKVNQYKPIIFLIVITSIQVFLGIYTLLSNLNIILASAHQITSVLLVLSAVNLYYTTIK